MVIKTLRRRQIKTQEQAETTAERRKQLEEGEREIPTDPRFRQMDEWARGDMKRDALHVSTPGWW